MIKETTLRGLGIIGGLLISSATFAAVPAVGPYAGLQLGWGHIPQDNISKSDVGISGLTTTSFSSRVSNENGLAGRLFAGYAFDQTWAAELGWSKFSDVKAKFNSSYSDGTTLNGSGSVKTDAVDLVAKGTYPLQNDFSIYGKLGVAYLMQRGHVNASGGGHSVSVNEDVKKLFPTFSVGAAYDITCNVATDLSWNRIQKVGSSNASSTDLVALGLIYKFA